MLDLQPETSSPAALTDASPASPRAHAPRRDLLIDVVRGLAIVLVALGHTNQGVARRGWWGTSNIGVHLDLAIYAFHMPAFFFVSGIFIKRSVSKRGERGYTLEKLRTMIYPYFLWAFIFAGATRPFARFMAQTTPPWRTFLFTLFTGAAPWFLPTLFFALMLGMLFRNLPMPLFFIAAASLSLWGPETDVMFFDRGLHHLVFLVAGMWVGASFKKLEAIPVWTSALAALLLAVVIYLVTASPFGLSPYLFIPLGLLGTLMLMLVANCMGHSPTARALAWTGAASFGIFLMSSFPQGAGRELLVRILHTTEPWLQLIFPTILAVVIPAWLYHQRKLLHIQWMFTWPF